MRNLLRRLWYWRQQRELEAALQEELEFHRALKQEELEAEGLSRDQARLAARREVGNVTRAREESRAVWISPWLDETWQDLRYAVRALVVSPSFTLTVLAILIITMGMTTTLYTFVDGVLLRPWAVADPDRVVVLTALKQQAGRLTAGTSHAEYRYLADAGKALDLVAFSIQSRGIQGARAEGDARAHVVSGNYFDVLGIPIVAGRPLQPADDRRGRPSGVAVVSFALAERQFGGPGQAVGQVVRVSEVPLTIVGVAGRGATDRQPALSAEVWLPFNALTLFKFQSPIPDGSDSFLDSPDACCVRIAGRLDDGVTRAAAEAELRVLAARFGALRRAAPTDITLRSTAQLYAPDAAGFVNTVLLWSAATALFLLLGCANIGNLVLARASARRGDITMRLWLGATRSRLVRHLLTETLVLAVAGGLASVAVADSAIPLIVQRLIPWTPNLVSVDLRTALFAGGLALFVTAIAGTLPALKATRIGPGMRVVGRVPLRLRNALLAFQMAACLILLVGATLVARGISHASGDALDTLDGKVAVQLGLPFRSGVDVEQLSGRLLDAIEREGLGPAAGAEFVPLRNYRIARDIRLPGEASPRLRSMARQAVTPGFFDVLEIARREGRIFDHRSAADDVVVEEAFARALWPDGRAVGRLFVDRERSAGRQEKRVIGVVADARTFRFDQVIPTYYERATSAPVLILRGAPDVARRVQALIRAEVPAARPTVSDPAARLRSQVEAAMVGPLAGAGIAIFALLLAAVGTFGVCRQTVNERVPEIGVRKALGAGPRDVVAMVVRGMAVPVAGGLIAGLCGAQALGIVLGERLYGISPRDPLAYGVVLVVMATIVVLALVGPVRRAVRVDPASMLRAE